MIPYGKHYVDEDDIEAVVSVLREGMLTQGPKVDELEKHIASTVSAKYAVAVSSGTAALHLACMVSDVDVDSIVYTSANTFVASANCVRYVGGLPRFCDIDQDTLNMSVGDLEARVAASGNLDVVIPVHFAGTPCEMKEIANLAKKYGAMVIEDASHALGGRYKSGEMIGSCVYSDMTVFSLHPVKGVTAGEGGVITTNNEILYKRLLSLRSHGICKGNFDYPGISFGDDSLIKSGDAFDDGELNPWYYEMQELGYNYRITDIQCALAKSQMKKLDRIIDRRRNIVAVYDVELKSHPYLRSVQKEHRDNSAHHLYVIRVDFQAIGKSRRNVMQQLAAQGIGSQVHYIPVPFHPYYESLGFQMSDYPEASKYYQEALSIPVYFSMTDEDQKKVISSLREVIC